MMSAVCGKRYVVLLGALASSSAFAPAVDAQPFLSRISPFEVLDEAGVPYRQPFLGGFNVPRPQFVDIDADGDPDLFVQERTNDLMLFEHTGSAEAFPYTWQTDRFQDLDIGEWYRFADVDGDGDFDLLAERSFSYIRYYRNAGTPSVPDFEATADSLKDDSGVPIFSDRQNIPNVIDIDCNGRPDLFIGRLDGTVSRYEVDEFTADGAPRFAFRGDRFQDIEIIGNASKQANDAARHGANTLLFADFDTDGDPDLLWGDFFEPGLLLIENQGTCAAPDFSTQPVPYPIENPLVTSGYNAPAVGDANGDGRLDLLVGVLGGAFSALSSSADNLIYFETAGNGELEQITRRYLSNIDVGSDAIPVLKDLDADADLDLVLTNVLDPADPSSARAVWYENQGTPTSPAFHFGGELSFEPAFNYAPTFGDLDGDGNLDILMGSWTSGVAWYRIVGAWPGISLVDEAFLDLPAGSNTTPTLGDLDADGDLDVLVGEAAGTISLFRNTGSAQSPTFNLETDFFGGIDVGRRSAPNLFDLDADGDLDLIIGSDQNGIQTYLNTGTPGEPVFEPVANLELPATRRMAPAPGDLNGDASFDLLVGTLEGGVLYFENQALETAVEPVQERDGLFEVSIYPNPSSVLATVHVRLNEEAILTVALYDDLGRRVGVVPERILQGEASRITLDLSHLAAGVYFVRVQAEDGRARVKAIHVR